MATKTLTASVNPDLYRRTREIARAGGQTQSTVVAEALSLYLTLPADIRAALRQLPPDATARALRSALTRGLWDDVIQRWRETLPPGEAKRLAGLSDNEVMERAVREVASGDEVSIRREGERVILEPERKRAWPPRYWERLDQLTRDFEFPECEPLGGRLLDFSLDDES